MTTFCEDVKTIIEEIATELKIKDFSVTYKSQDFTGENYLGQITRVKLLDKEADSSINLFLKEPPNDEAARKAMPVTVYYQREVYTYTNILPTLEEVQEKNNIPIEERFHFPKYYKGCTEEFKEFLIMQDMSFEGFKINDKCSPVKNDQMQLVVKNLARLHAASFVLKQKNPDRFIELSANIAQSMNYGDSIPKMVEVYAKQFLPSIYSSENRTKLEKFILNIKSLVFELLDANESAPYNVICHGDCWINNILFKYSMDKVVDVMFIDWQIIRLASPITDLAYTMFLITDEPLREKYYDKLLELYYETMKHNVEKMGCDMEVVYPRHIFQNQVKKIMPFGLMMALVAIPFQLKEPGSKQKLEDAVEDIENEDLVLKFTDEVVVRLNAIVNDFVKLEYI